MVGGRAQVQVDIVRSLLALSLLAVLAWIAGYYVCLKLLTWSLWSPKLHLEERFPPDRFRTINRTVSFVVGLIVMAVTLWYCAPPTIRSF